MRRYPLPGPYDSRMNLPLEMRRLPFSLIRSNAPAYVIRQGVEEFRNEQFNPFAVLHKAYGPFSHPVGGVQAVAQSRRNLQALQIISNATMRSPVANIAYQPSPPHMPQVAFGGSRVPGFGVQEIPFAPLRDNVPVAAAKVQSVLQSGTLFSPSMKRFLSRLDPEGAARATNCITEF